ncbi:MAG TPA: O-antigen ligase family protein [Acetobacteraceae bacterium]|nr:O-antigen ligase family protein [Acetobacteraceae bacterium]
MSAASLTGVPIPLALARTALGAVLLIPLLLLHAHGIAEVAIGVTDVCFLARAAILREWRWLRTPWLLVAMTWWGWVLLCSLPIPALGLGEGGASSLLQAVVGVRFPIFVAALEFLVLAESAHRRWMFGLIAASVAWIVLNCLVQLVIGYNLIGWSRGPDGELTGPFGKPRAGTALARIILPAIVPPAVALLARRGLRDKLAAYALLLGGLVIMVLISQRMPLVLVAGGLAVTALLLRPLRPAVLAAAVAAGLLLATSSVVAPEAYHRLVVKFSAQLDHFPTTQYGQLYARALEIGVQNPVTGLGFDGFKTGCKQPRYFRPTFDGSQPDGGGAKICWVHPHNFYFQAWANGGAIGLGLFGLTAVFWLLPLARGLWRDPDPLRVAIFATILVQLWPIQSTSSFTSMPLGGWFFLILGWGMAEARYRTRQ